MQPVGPSHRVGLEAQWECGSRRRHRILRRANAIRGPDRPPRSQLFRRSHSDHSSRSIPSSREGVPTVTASIASSLRPVARSSSTNDPWMFDRQDRKAGHPERAAFRLPEADEFAAVDGCNRRSSSLDFDAIVRYTTKYTTRSRRTHSRRHHTPSRDTRRYSPQG